jgi:hypothetical protein
LLARALYANCAVNTNTSFPHDSVIEHVCT